MKIFIHTLVSLNISMEDKSLNIKQKNIKIDCIYANGCSMTAGDELSKDIIEQARYPSLVAAHYNVPVYNNARGGGSNARIVRTSTQDLVDLKSQGRFPFVIIGWTAHHRFEVCNQKHEWLQFNAGKEKSKDPEFEKLYWSKYGSDIGNIESFAVQVMLLQKFLESYEIPYLMLHAINPVVIPRNHKLNDFVEHLDYKYFLPEITLRGYLTQWPKIEFGEGGHPLEQGHKKISEFVIELIENRYEIRKM